MVNTKIRQVAGKRKVKERMKVQRVQEGRGGGCVVDRDGMDIAGGWSGVRSGILKAVGNTPLVALEQLYPDVGFKVYAKLEGLNPGGSIKDRTAVHIVAQAVERGEINEHTVVVESSSGNMAVGLAQVCLHYGIRFIAVVDPLINGTTLKLIETYGAELVKVEQANENGGYLEARLSKVQELCAAEQHSFWPNQYANPDNPGAHFETMREIAAELHGRVDYVLAATSTCGTLMGCALAADRLQLNTRIVAVDARGSAIFGDVPSPRLLPGHGAARASELLDLDQVEQHIHVSDYESIVGCHRLLQKEAILAGASSGALVMALEQLAPGIAPGSNVVLILSDRGERYLDTVYSEAWVAEHFAVERLGEKENIHTSHLI